MITVSKSLTGDAIAIFIFPPLLWSDAFEHGNSRPSSRYGLRLFESTEKPEILECIELSLKCNEADDDFKGEVDAKEIFTHDDGRMGVEQDRLLDLNELFLHGD